MHFIFFFCIFHLFFHVYSLYAYIYIPKPSNNQNKPDLYYLMFSSIIFIILSSIVYSIIVLFSIQKSFFINHEYRMYSRQLARMWPVLSWKFKFGTWFFPVFEYKRNEMLCLSFSILGIIYFMSRVCLYGVFVRRLHY